jgi:K+-sensing histidine kinase KdpD
MTIEDCILTTYPTIQPYANIKSIENRLKEKDYLVIIDEKNKFYGILTPSDILTRNGKLVIDCLTPKEILQTNDTFIELAVKFEKTPSEALPVFQDGEYLGILEKNDLIKKLKSRMDDLHEELIISQNVKTAFLQILSHEVRTPLNHIIGFISIIADLSPEEIEPNREEFYAIIKKSSEQFLSIMNDLIELSRLYSGDKLHVCNGNTSIESVFADIKANFDGKVNFSDWDVDIRYHNPDTALIIYTDSKKIKLIIHRLLNCTIKQLQKNEGIEFGYELFVDKQKIRFYVKNTNTQITMVPENIKSDAFRKSIYPTYSYHSGSGFQIEQARKMVELLDGTLDIEEFETDNKIIYFTIPYNSPEIR